MTLILPRVNGPKPRSSLNAWYYVVITSKNQWRFPEKLTTSEIERPSEGHDLFAPATTELVVERGIEIRERERIPAELRLGN